MKMTHSEQRAHSPPSSRPLWLKSLAVGRYTKPRWGKRVVCVCVCCGAVVRLQLWEEWGVFDVNEAANTLSVKSWLRGHIDGGVRAVWDRVFVCVHVLFLLSTSMFGCCRLYLLREGALFCVCVFLYPVLKLRLHNQQLCTKCCLVC